MASSGRTIGIVSLRVILDRVNELLRREIGNVIQKDYEWHGKLVTISEVEVTQEAEDAWVGMLEGTVRGFIGNPECTPGYYNNEGKPAARSVQGGSYGGGPVAFVQVLEQWRAEGDMRGLLLNT